MVFFAFPGLDGLGRVHPINGLASSANIDCLGGPGGCSGKKRHVLLRKILDASFNHGSWSRLHTTSVLEP